MQGLTLGWRKSGVRSAGSAIREVLTVSLALQGQVTLSAGV